MIYVLTVRNKSGLQVTWNGSPCSRLVYDFAAANSRMAKDVIDKVLLQLDSEDEHIKAGIQLIRDDLWDGGYEEGYSNTISGLQVSWREGGDRVN